MVVNRDGTEARPAPRWPRRRGAFSPITRRILAINLAALVMVVAGLLYLDIYRGTLIDAKITALATQGELIAAALGESVVSDPDDDGVHGIDAAAARQMLARLTAPIETRTRLYDAHGALVADSRNLPGTGDAVQVATLPPPAGPLTVAAEAVYDWVVALLSSGDRLPPYVETTEPHASDYSELRPVFAGGHSSALRDGGDMGVILNVAVPVQRFKEVQGALLLTTTTDDVEDSVRQVRYTILKLFGAALAVTVLLSLYLAGTIARPLHRLAEAADSVRYGHGQGHGQGRQADAAIPDFSGRGDEIGDLSQALGDMTRALDERIVAIERFAADVAHEIKNPLSSLRVAVETASRIEDPAGQRELLAVARDDVLRLYRLITDISDASRLDAELARAETGPVDIGALLTTLVDIERTAAVDGGPSVVLEIDPSAAGPLVAEGVEGRFAQVFQNIIANAKSFSRPGGAITIAARRGPSDIEITIEDQGPGIPAGKLAAIFERFYTERPAGEKFGIHSGLGLSISRQIIEAHGGVIFAENRGDDPDHPTGARFVVRLPA